MTIGDIKRDRLRRRHHDRALVIDQQGRSARRRRGRRTYWSLAATLMLLLVAAAPSLLCQSTLGQALIRRGAPQYALEASFQSVRFGWLTPLRLTGLDATGTAGGTRLRIDQLDSNVTLLRYLGGMRDAVRTSVRGVTLELSVDDNWSSLEADLAAIASAGDADEHGDDSSGLSQLSKCTLDVQNLTIRVTDVVTGAMWGVDQARAELELEAGQLEARFSAIVSEPQAGSGSIDAVVRCQWTPQLNLQAEANLQGLPLGVASLVRRRLPDLTPQLPEQLSGDASGTVQIAASAEGVWSLELSPLELRNLVASGPSLGNQVWRNGLAVAEGAARLDANGLSSKSVRVTTDFAEIALDGAFSGLTSPSAPSNLTAWLSSLEGTATASIDLVAMAERLPGFIPLRDKTELISGAIAAEIVSQADAPGARRIQGSIQSQAIRARAAGRPVVFEPAAVVASLRVDDAGLWRADRCQLTSSFGSATLDGDLSRGRATADLNLGRLATMLEPLIDLPELSLGGVATGEMKWSVQAAEQWRLQGDGNATGLTIGFPGGIQLHRPQLAVHVDASGRWDGKSLRELTAAEVSLRSSSLEADASLLASVSEPSSETSLPLQLSGRGRLEVLAEFLSPWMPQSLHSLHGGFSGHAQARVGWTGGQLTTANIQLQEPRCGWGKRLYVQNEVAIDFEGNYTWPSGDLVAQSLTLTGEAVSASIQGTISAELLDCELAWRAKLDALQGSAQRLVASDRPQDHSSDRVNVRSVAFAGPPRLASAATASGQWMWQGDCEGNVRLRRPRGDNQITIETRATGTELAILSTSDASATRRTSGSPAPRLSNAASGAANRGDVLWDEANLQGDGVLLYDLSDGRLAAKKLQLTSDWISTTLSGEIQWDERHGAVRLSGPARVRMPQVALQLTALAGTPISLTGIHETPLDISIDRRADGTAAMRVTASLGWETGEIAGVGFGPSSIPVVISESKASIQRSTVPVDQGRLHIAGDIHYHPGPLRMQVKPGVIAQNLRLTPQLSERWLQYLAPMVAQATRIDGTFGVDLSEATVNLEEPLRSRVRGQLQINQVDFDSGPVVHQLLSSVQQIQLIARGRSAAESGPASGTAAQPRKIATLPTQSVDFDFTDGVITHQRMFMEIDRAQLITSGQVHVDGRLDLVTQVPLQAAWLGNDLRALAGRTVNLPVTGTLSRPRLDPSAVRDLVGQVGAQAIQNSAENYLEKQLNRGLERLLGK